MAGGGLTRESLVAEGLNLRQQGEEQATALTVSVVQTKVEQFYRRSRGPGVKSRAQCRRRAYPKGAGGFCRRTRGFQEFLKRTVAEVLAMEPDQVEVKRNLPNKKGNNGRFILDKLFSAYLGLQKLPAKAKMNFDPVLLAE